MLASAGGIAEYLELDPTIVRLMEVVLAVVTVFLPVPLGHVLGWTIIPHKPAT
jgi:phage shock protein PspC (stress-responsive transcriptional regulator)